MLRETCVRQYLYVSVLFELLTGKDFVMVIMKAIYLKIANYLFSTINKVLFLWCRKDVIDAEKNYGGF